MSIVGNQEKVTMTGTYNLSNAGMVGVSGATGFVASRVDPGDSIIIGGSTEFIVKTVIGATAFTVYTDEFGATGIVTQTAQTVFISQKPKYLQRVSPRPGHLNDNNTRKDVYGVDAIEVGAGFGKVTSVAMVKEGAGYGATPAITFGATGFGGGASGIALTTNGHVTGIQVLATGATYFNATPSVTVAAPSPLAFIAGASGVDVTNNRIVFGSTHFFRTGDLVILGATAQAAITVANLPGATGATGLLNGATFFAVKGATGANGYSNWIMLATSYNAAIDMGVAATGATGYLYTGQLDLSVAGPVTNQTFRGETALATADVGATSASRGFHAGWVKRVVGTGARAGRVLYETLVVQGGTGFSNQFDTEDIVFPDV